ncbi:MAG: calcium-binding protein [Paracoccaceae bacterium]
MSRLLTLTVGNDTFTQGLGADNIAIQINALAGNDIINLNRSDDLGGDNVVDAGAGNDTVINHREFGNLTALGDGNDTYVGLGFDSFSSDPFDQVLGGTGNDRFFVQTFGSRYFGEAGNDSFFSVGWKNTFHGGDGADSISYLPRDDDFTQGGTGVLINLAAGFAQTGAIARETLISIESATGTSQNDTIIGSSVGNRLTGGLGFDLMVGGAAADAFVFNSTTEAPILAGAVDRIADFQHAQGDRVDLRAIDAETNLAGDQAFHFIGGAGFGRDAGELRFSAGFLIGDVNGDGVADFRILMSGVAALVQTDIFL